MTTITDYTTIVPTEPPEELLPWMRRKGLLHSEAMIYEADYATEWDFPTEPPTATRRKCVRVSCSCCEAAFHAQYREGQIGCCGQRELFGFYHPETGRSEKNYGESTCPLCGTEVKVYHCGAVRDCGHTLEHHRPVTVHVVDGLPMIIQWEVCRRVEWINKHAVTTDKIYPHEAYVYTGKSTIKLVAYDQFMCNYHSRRYWTQRAKCTDGVAHPKLRMDFDPEIFRGTFAENSHLAEYIAGNNCCPVTYLRLYQKHPQIENLVMQGAAPLLDSLILENSRYKSSYRGGYPTMNLPEVDWKEVRPARMLGLTKPEFRAAISAKWGVKELTFYQAAKAHGIRPEDAALCMTYGATACLNWLEQNRPLMKDLRYLEKQKKQTDLNHIRLLTLKYLADYLDMAGQLGDDLHDPSLRWPQHLIAAHDTASTRYTLRKNEIERAKFVRRYGELKKFCWASDELEIHPAHSQEEMIREGQLLHHCVARYAADHAEGKTAIFFIRRSIDPEKPFYTLELDEHNGTVRQNRGKCNCARTEEVTAFEKAWLKYVQRIVKIEKERQKHGIEMPKHLPYRAD